MTSSDPIDAKLTASSHFDSRGQARMVDVSDKAITARVATAQAIVVTRPETLEMIRQGNASKGDVLGIARIAAIQAVKQTPAIIPLCHAIPIDAVDVGFDFVGDDRLDCRVTVRSTGRTGVEMEAMTGAAAAALTIYDMCKSVDREMRIENVRLLAKQGGKSGTFQAAELP